MRKLIALVVFWCAGCGAPQPGDNLEAGSVAPSQAAARTPKAPQRVPKANGASMTAEFKPSAAFRAYAAKVLNVAVHEVVGSVVEETAAQMPHSIGGAWACDMSHGEREVRGWVTADATVIAADQNLGLLFVEAGVWQTPPKMSLNKLASLIAGELAWSFGENHGVVRELADGMAPPRITLAADGSGSMRFFVHYRRPGPGGAGGGPASHFEVNIALTADHKAALTKKPFQPS